MRIWWVLPGEGSRSCSISSGIGKRSDSSLRSRTLADPRTTEGFQICVSKGWRAASSSGSCWNGITQGSWLSRKTHPRGDPRRVALTPHHSRALLWIGMKMVRKHCAVCVGELSSPIQWLKCRIKHLAQPGASSSHSCDTPCHSCQVGPVPTPPTSGNRFQQRNQDSRAVSEFRLASCSTCIYTKAALSWNKQISLLMGLLCKIFLEPES